MPRMPARVFVALLSTDSGHLTAAELASLLQVSPPAISGSIGLLTRLDLVRRQRVPGPAGTSTTCATTSGTR
ncbi:helix-turn-helix domain-containing protein [Streptomyces sp. M19]